MEFFAFYYNYENTVRSYNYHAIYLKHFKILTSGRIPHTNWQILNSFSRKFVGFCRSLKKGCVSHYSATLGSSFYDTDSLMCFLKIICFTKDLSALSEVQGYA